MAWEAWNTCSSAGVTRPDPGAKVYPNHRAVGNLLPHVGLSAAW